MASLKPTKRTRVDSDSEDEAREKAKGTNASNAWVRYLVVEGTDDSKPLAKLSPFAINKFFEGVSADFVSIKRLRGGSFLVECRTQKASDRLLKRDGTSVIGCPIRVSVHKGLNSCKGVIRCRELADLSEAEIKSELQSQGVCDVHRVTVRKGSDRVPTNTYFVTFALSTLPESIKVGYLRVKVSLYVPSPIRCFQCNRFGHLSKFCKNEKTCARCAKTAHEGECASSAVCVNCKGGHSASSKECPVWKVEAEIQRVRVEKKLPFFEARKIVEERQGSGTLAKSFANVVKSRTECRSSECQTDLSWITGERPRRLPSDGGETVTAEQAGPKPATKSSQATSEKPAPTTRDVGADGESSRARSLSASRPPRVGKGPVPGTDKPEMSVSKPSPAQAGAEISGKKTDKANKYKTGKPSSDRKKKAELQPIPLSNRFDSLSDDDYMSS